MSRRWILILILVFAGLLRLWRLDAVPEGFHADEASFGYNAFSLLRTGRDEYGKLMPLTLESFGDQKGALYAYLTVPFISVFGLTPFAVRLPTALAGIILVGLIYALVNKLSKNETLALTAAALTAVSPVSVSLSRVQSDPLVSAGLFFAGMYLLIVWFTSKRPLHLVLSAVLVLMSMMTYHVTKVAYPVYVLSSLFWYRGSLSGRQKFLTFLAMLAVTAVGLYVTVSSPERFLQLSSIGGAQASLQLESEHLEDGVMDLPPLIARMFHNKVTANSGVLIDNYAAYFSPSQLFLQSVEPRRERIPATGFLLLTDAPFLLAGIYFIIRRKATWGYLMLSWIFLGTVTFAPSGHETPNIHRFLISLLPVYAVVAYGITGIIQSFRQIRRTISAGMVIILYGINLAFFLHQLFIHQPVHEPYFRDFAYRPLIGKLVSISGDYDLIVFSKANGNPYIHWLFWTGYDPAAYQHSGSRRDLDYVRFDKFYFVPEDCPSEEIKYWPIKSDPAGAVLFVNRGSCGIGPNSRKLDTVSWRNGLEAFQLVGYVATASARR